VRAEGRLAAGSGPIADQRVRRGVAATGKAGLRQVAPHPDTTQGGWVAGGGFEWMITNNWLLRGEYLYYSLGNSPSGHCYLSGRSRT
jgi:opacity protein-like surface antigen